MSTNQTTLIIVIFSIIVLIAVLLNKPVSFFGVRINEK